MPKRQSKQRKIPSSELFIHGEVESWHVLMVSHDERVEVPRERAQFEESLPDGGTKYTHRAVSDHLELEMTLRLREPIRGYDQLHLRISEWEAEEYGGIAGELRYDKESGMRGGVHISGNFTRDFYQLLLSGRKAVMAIQTEKGFFRRRARVTSLAFANEGHSQWIDGESSLI
jgi:hypothetical protein